MSTVAVQIKEDTFGEVPTPKGPVKVRRFTLISPGGAQAQIINYGATITSLKIPDRNGKLDDVVLGFDTIEGYLSGQNRYFGTTVGRVCNRTAKGKFTLGGCEYQLGINNGPNHLHGGIAGFDKKMWDAYTNYKDGKVTMSYLSVDGEEGYPGNLLVNVTFELTSLNELLIEYQATTSQPTPIGFTNHSYFNLAGDHAADKGLEGHYIQLNADNYTPVDENLITTGEKKPVEGTLFDLRKPTQSLPQLLSQFPSGPNGYDHNFCLNKRPQESWGLAGVIQENGSGRVLVIHCDQPGVQFYTSNFLPDKDATVGKNGARYMKHGAFCMETQNYPNAINYQGRFPNAVLCPGEVYRHKVSYNFLTTVAWK